MLYQVQRQRTAGAYIGVKNCLSHEEAADYIRSVAANYPNRPYDGGDKWQTGSNVHNVDRYRIVTIEF